MVKSEIIQISDDLFLKLGKLITERYGIKMTIEKKIMFQSRLQKRLRELNMFSFEEYAGLLNFKRPRRISPYILFTKTYRAHIRNEDSLLSSEQRSFSSMGEKLGSMWDNLPYKGKLDYSK